MTASHHSPVKDQRFGLWPRQTTSSDIKDDAKRRFMTKAVGDETGGLNSSVGGCLRVSLAPWPARLRLSPYSSWDWFQPSPVIPHLISWRKWMDGPECVFIVLMTGINFFYSESNQKLHSKLLWTVSGVHFSLNVLSSLAQLPWFMKTCLLSSCSRLYSWKHFSSENTDFTLYLFV